MSTYRRRVRLLKIDPYCFYCNFPLDETNSTIDHVIPRSKGGLNQNNTVLACEDCNKKKGDSDPVLIGVDLSRAICINKALKQLTRLACKINCKNDNTIASMKKSIEELIVNIRNTRPKPVPEVESQI